MATETQLKVLDSIKVSDAQLAAAQAVLDAQEDVTVKKVTFKAMPFKTGSWGYQATITLPNLGKKEGTDRVVTANFTVDNADYDKPTVKMAAMRAIALANAEERQGENLSATTIAKASPAKLAESIAHTTPEQDRAMLEALQAKLGAKSPAAAAADDDDDDDEDD